MLRDELKKTKNLLGAIFITLATLAMCLWLDESLPDTGLYIAAGLYLIGMILIIVNPGKTGNDQAKK